MKEELPKEQKAEMTSMEETLAFLSSSNSEEKRKDGELFARQIKENAIDRKLFVKIMGYVGVPVPETKVELWLKKMLEKESSIKLPESGSFFS